MLVIKWLKVLSNLEIPWILKTEMILKWFVISANAVHYVSLNLRKNLIKTFDNKMSRKLNNFLGKIILAITKN